MVWDIADIHHHATTIILNETTKTHSGGAGSVGESQKLFFVAIGDCKRRNNSICKLHDRPILLDWSFFHFTKIETCPKHLRAKIREEFHETNSQN